MCSATANTARIEQETEHQAVFGGHIEPDVLRCVGLLILRQAAECIEKMLLSWCGHTQGSVYALTVVCMYVNILLQFYLVPPPPQAFQSRSFIDEWISSLK